MGWICGQRRRLRSTTPPAVTSVDLDPSFVAAIDAQLAGSATPRDQRWRTSSRRLGAVLELDAGLVVRLDGALTSELIVFEALPSP